MHVNAPCRSASPPPAEPRGRREAAARRAAARCMEILLHCSQHNLAIALQLIRTILEFEAVTSDGYQRLIFLFYACGIVLGTAAVDAIGYQEAWTAAPRDDSELYGVEDAGHFRATEFIDPIEALIKTRHGSKKQGDRPCYRNTGVFGGVGGCVV